MWWGRNNQQNQAQNLRQQQINDLKKNPSVITITENRLYECRFKTRLGGQSFLIELPPQFPQMAPILKFRTPVNHQFVPGPEKMIIRTGKLNSWGPHTSINGVIQECLVKFVSAPPQPLQVQNPPPPSFNQYQQQQHGYQPPPQYGNQARPMGAPGYQQPGGFQPPPQYNQARPMGGYQPPNQFQPQPQPGFAQPAQPNRDSTKSNQSQQSIQSEPEEDIVKLTFQPPADFEMLQHFDRDALNQVLTNDNALKDLAIDCPEYKQARTILDDTRKALRESTEQNLREEPRISAEQQRLEQARAEVAAIQHEYENLKKRQERVMQKYSVKSIDAELDQAIMEVDDQCATLKESFENEEMKIVKYVNQLIKLKKLSHIRQIKKSRIGTLQGR